MLTRYLLQNGHVIAQQNTLDATVWRTVKTTSTMLDQRIR